MTERLPALQRALAMASSGEVSTLTELRTRLRREGYGNDTNSLWGKHLKMQLIRLIHDAKRTDLC